MRIPRPITGRLARRRALLTGRVQTGRLSLLNMLKQRDAVEQGPQVEAHESGDQQQPLDELEMEQWDEIDDDREMTPQEPCSSEGPNAGTPKRCPQSGDETLQNHGGSAEPPTGSLPRMEMTPAGAPEEENNADAHDRGDDEGGPSNPMPVTGTLYPSQLF